MKCRKDFLVSRSLWAVWMSCVLALIAVAPQLQAKDLGMTYGQTTPAFAMYLAQMRFADERCISSGLTEDTDSAKLLKKRFGNMTSTSVYLKKDAEFASLIDGFHASYDSAWNLGDETERASFCAGFNKEVAQCKDGCIRWAMPILYLRRQLTPLSGEAEARAKLFATLASTAGVVVSSAASVSASRQSLSSAKAGDFVGSSQALAEGQAFGQFGSAALALGNTVSEQSPPTSVLEVVGDDGRMAIVRCPVTDHFNQFSAPADADIWITYQPVSARCRDLTLADLELMKY